MQTNKQSWHSIPHPYSAAQTWLAAYYPEMMAITAIMSAKTNPGQGAAEGEILQA